MATPTIIDGLPTFTLNALPTAGTIDGVNDILPIYTNSVTATQGINRNTLLGLSSAPVGLTDSQTLTNKTLTNPTINAATLSGTIAGTYTLGGTPTFPATVVTTTGTQTLTNKTLTSPTINAPTISNGTISTDSITGFSTSNSGSIFGITVSAGTIGNAALAANAVGTSQIASNAVVTAGVADGAITPAKLFAGAGTTWVWQDFSSTITINNFTLGNGVKIARYVQIGKTVIGFVSVVLGSTSTMGTNLSYSLPVTGQFVAGGGDADMSIGNSYMEDSGGTGYTGFTRYISSTVAQPSCQTVSSTYAITTLYTATVPVTWGANCFWRSTFIYEAA